MLHIWFIAINVLYWIALYASATTDPGYLPCNAAAYDEAIKQVLKWLLLSFVCFSVAATNCRTELVSICVHWPCELLLNCDWMVLVHDVLFCSYFVHFCMVGYWHGCLSVVRCKWFAYGPADATATPSSLAAVKSRIIYLSGAGLPRLSWKKGH